MLDWIQSLVGALATIVIAIFLLLVSVASEILEWIVWLKLRRERPATQMRKTIELTSVVAGTASIVLFGLFLLEVSVANWVAWGAGWAIDLWIFVGMGVCWLALVVSPFCRSKLRLAGTLVGVLMAGFWWELWDAVQFAR